MDIDIARIGRVLIQMLLTVGAAIGFFILVVAVCGDVWVGSDPVSVKKVYSAVTISLSITFGSAFVGWLGLSSRETNVEPVSFDTDKRLWRTRAIWPVVGKLLGSLPGAALVAMLLYLVAGAVAGVTYIFNESDTPPVIVAVATAWAAQASAIIASTLAVALKPDERAPA